MFQQVQEHCSVYSVDIDSLDAAVAQDPEMFDISHISDDLLIEESGKVVFVIGLIENLRAENHRCLVFSASRRMLDIIQKVMKNRVSFSHCTNSRVSTPPGKSWKLKLKVLVSPGKISLKVVHFSSGLNGKQAAIV